MPSSLHHGLTEMFRRRPELAAEMLAEALGRPGSAYRDASLVFGDMSDLTPTEYRADAVVMLTDADGAVSAVVVEVQLGDKRDRDKYWTWPVYLATLRARLRCPTTLLVVCVDRRTAGWCAAPIDMGHPGWMLCPVVLGPDRIPVVTDVDQAGRGPELAALSLRAHVEHPDWPKVADALLRTLSPKFDGANHYYDVIVASLPVAARRMLEAMVSTGTYQYQSDFARRYFSEGEAKAVVTVLDARGIEVPDEARDRITSCTDIEQLEVWVRRAATATSVDDLFA